MISGFNLPNYNDDIEFLDQITSVDNYISNKRKFDTIGDYSIIDFVKLFPKEISIEVKLNKIYSECNNSIDLLSQNIEFQNILKYFWDTECIIKQINPRNMNKMFNEILYLIPRIGLKESIINTRNSIDYLYREGNHSNDRSTKINILMHFIYIIW